MSTVRICRECGASNAHDAFLCHECGRGTERYEKLADGTLIRDEEEQAAGRQRIVFISEMSSATDPERMTLDELNHRLDAWKVVQISGGVGNVQAVVLLESR